jgi:hypothetical protein
VSPSEDELVRQVARAIEEYLLTHPDAADSAKGIMEWWLPPHLHHATLERVVAALQLLAAKGKVTRTAPTLGEPTYSNTFWRQSDG